MEERLATVEARLDEQAHVTDAIRDAIVQLEQRMDRRFDAVDHRFDAMERRFIWMMGLQVGTLAAVLTAFIGVVTFLAQ
jgi:uncharacterized coiled-coil protein SlyX